DGGTGPELSGRTHPDAAIRPPPVGFAHGALVASCAAPNDGVSFGAKGRSQAGNGLTSLPAGTPTAKSGSLPFVRPACCIPVSFLKGRCHVRTALAATSLETMSPGPQAAPDPDPRPAPARRARRPDRPVYDRLEQPRQRIGRHRQLRNRLRRPGGAGPRRR